jgi:PKD repeat protein
MLYLFNIPAAAASNPGSIQFEYNANPLTLPDGTVLIQADGRQTLKIRATVPDGITGPVFMTDNADKLYRFLINNDKTGWLRVGPRSSPYVETIDAYTETRSADGTSNAIKFVDGNLRLFTSPDESVFAGSPVTVIAQFRDGSTPIEDVPVTLSVKYANGTTAKLGPVLTDASGNATFANLITSPNNLKSQANVFTAKIDKLGLSKSAVVNCQVTDNTMIDHFSISTIPEKLNITTVNSNTFSLTADVGQPLTIIAQAVDVYGNPVSSKPAFKVVFTDTSGNGNQLPPVTINSKSVASMVLGAVRYPQVVSYLITTDTGVAATHLNVRYSNKPSSMTISSSPNVIASSEVEQYRLNLIDAGQNTDIKYAVNKSKIVAHVADNKGLAVIEQPVNFTIDPAMGSLIDAYGTRSNYISGMTDANGEVMVTFLLSPQVTGSGTVDIMSDCGGLSQIIKLEYKPDSHLNITTAITPTSQMIGINDTFDVTLNIDGVGWQAGRKPIDLIFTVDTSGSMGDALNNPLGDSAFVFNPHSGWFAANSSINNASFPIKATNYVENSRSFIYNHTGNTRMILNLVPLDPVPTLIADFTAENTTGVKSVNVSFKSMVTGTPTAWQWNFGDGSANSTMQNPSHLYDRYGKYVVTMTTYNVTGAMDTCQKVDFVTVERPAAPEADFNMNPTSGVAPQVVNFDSYTSTGDYITARTWSFGDGSDNVSSPVATHTFLAGTWTVTLNVSNDGGSDIAQRTITVVDPPLPLVNFTMDKTSGMWPLSVTFTDRTVAQSVEEYVWNFGDGSDNVSSSTPINPVHTFANNGIYTIKLYVKNLVGMAMAEQTVTVSNPPAPTAAFSASTATTGVWPLTVNFADASSVTNPAVYPTKWEWNFGEGSNVTASTAAVQSHVYNTPGTYTVTLTVSNAGGSSSVQRLNYIVVNNPPVPTALFSTSPTTGTWPLQVAFTEQSSVMNPSTYATTWNWQFGDGTTFTSTSSTNPTHKYNTSGSFTVNLTVTNVNGSNTKQVTNAVVVSDPAKPTVDFTPNKTSGYYSPGVPFCVLFTDNTVTPDPAVYDTTWIWNFGEGSNVTTTTRTNPVHTYNNPGVYTVKLYVTNPVGTSMSQKTVTLSTPPLMNVDFKANVTSGIYPLCVQFTDLSQQASWYPDEYQWNFGDTKGNSSARHPVHTFDNAGTYTVTLTVHNAAGFNTTQKIANITVLNPSAPTVNFVANKTSDWAGVPVTIKFNDTSSGLYMSAWEWNFGDGTGNVTERNTTHTFTAAGNYTVMLTVTNPGGSSTKSVVDYIKINTPPLATVNFVADNTSYYYPYGLTTKFNDTSSGIYMSEWYWNFGDGTTSTQRNVTHTYSDVGNYTVTLTVKNPAGNATATKTDFIKVLFPAAPVANLTGTPLSGDISLSVKFNDTTTGLFLNAWEWNFGDGSMPVTARNTTHVYTAAGLYNVTLAVTNALGNVSTVTKTNYINVTNPAELPPTQIKPVCNFEANQTSGVAPMMVQFTDKSTVGQPQVWAWDFGDSYNPGNGTIQNPVHTYTKPGDYTVILTVTNAAGSNSSKKVNYIHVAPPAPPVCNFVGDVLDGIEPLKVNFTDLSTGYGISSWQWNFGDGTANSTARNPQHTYGVNAAGLRTVTLTVTNDGGSTTCQKVGYINVRLPAAPTADFTMSPVAGTAPLQVTFTDRSTGGPLQWQWDFGDGHSSTQQNPTNTFARAGNYTVTLRASNDGGPGAACIKYVNVTDPVLPVVDFSATPTSGYYAGTPFGVQFTDLTTGASLSSWSWNFGDNTGNSSERNPLHPYSGAGNFTVTLTVTNIVGATVTKQKVGYINVTLPDKPVVDFTVNKTEGVWPLSIQFTDTTTGMFLGTRQWNFGDSIVNDTSINPVHTYTTNGTFNVTLMVTNPGGSVTIKKVGFITVNNPPAPTADFSASPTTGQWPLNVAFTDLSTVTNPTTVYNTVWKWEFGDGVIATYTTKTNPTHLYNSSNTFTVKLTVTNAGGSSVKTMSNYVTTSNPAAPTVSFAANVTSGIWPLTVGFTDNTVTANTAVYTTTWQWNFGDGTSNVSSTSKTSPSHTFNKSGVFTVTLTVANIGGSTTSQIVNCITVNNPALPSVEFSANQTIGNRPLCVKFNDNTNTANPAVYTTTWDWNFGDGSDNVTSSSSSSPVHIYTVAGTYTVTLNVTNPAGSIVNRKVSYVTVNNPPKPNVDFSANVTSGDYTGRPFCVQFTDGTTGTGLQSWEWSFGDNTANSTSRNTTHTYNAAGTYTVVLTVTNVGGSSTAVKTGFIRIALPAKPTASFTASRTSGYTPLTVNFGNTSTGNYISAMEWNFGDGTVNVTGVQNPSHTFTHQGTYTVMLTVWNPGGSSTATRTITATTQDPDAHFHASSVSIKSGQQVTLYDDSTDGTPTEWHWTLWDGKYTWQYSNEQNPTFTLYADDVNKKTKYYDVYLEVENEGGDDAKYVNNYIKVSPATIYSAAESGSDNDQYYISVTDAMTNAVVLDKSPAGQYILNGGELADPATGEFSSVVEALPAGLYNITLYRNYTGGEPWGYRLDVYDTLKLGQSVDTDSIAKEAIRGYIDQLDTSDRVGLVNFSTGSRLISPLAYIEGADKVNLINAVNGLNSNGATDTSSGMKEARTEFESKPKADSMKIEILLTDGVPDTPDKDNETIYSEIYSEIQAACDSHITIYVIGLASDRSEVNETLLQTIADRTGGKYYFVDMGDVLQLSNAYKSIGKDIDDHITKDDSHVYLIKENENVTYVDHTAMLTNNTGIYSVDPTMTTDGVHTTMTWPISAINLGQKIVLKYTMKGVTAGYTYPVSNLSYGSFYNQTGSTMRINITGPQLFVRNNSSTDSSSYNMLVNITSPVKGPAGYYNASQDALDVTWNVTYHGLADYTWTVDCAPTGTGNYKVIASGKGILSDTPLKYSAIWDIQKMDLVSNSLYDLRVTATDSYGLFTSSDNVTVKIPYLYSGDSIIVKSGADGEKKASY